MKNKIKKDAYRLLNKQGIYNKINIIDIWDIEVKLEKKYKSVPISIIESIVKEIIKEKKWNK